MKIGEECKAVEELTYSNEGVNYTLDLSKPMPMRTREEKANEERINNYLLNGDHCGEPSPVLKNGSILVPSQGSDQPVEQKQPEKII